MQSTTLGEAATAVFGGWLSTTFAAWSRSDRTFSIPRSSAVATRATRIEVADVSIRVRPAVHNATGGDGRVASIQGMHRQVF
jgi:uncharacterized membrane-anchored protein